MLPRFFWLHPPQSPAVTSAILPANTNVAHVTNPNDIHSLYITAIFPLQIINPMFRHLFSKVRPTGNWNNYSIQKKMHNFDAVVAVTKGIRIQNGKKVVVK